MQFLDFPATVDRYDSRGSWTAGIAGGELDCSVEARMRVPLVAVLGIGVLGIGAVAGTTLALKWKTIGEEPSILASDSEENETELSAASGGTVALSTPPRPAFIAPAAASAQGGVTTAGELPAQDPSPKAAQDPLPKVAQAQRPPAAAVPPAPAGSVPASASPSAAATSSCPGNPNALGISRVVEVDTTGGPGFGFEHFKTHDFLRPGEVVLTFDDGPWPKNTAMVLQALAFHCTKAIFFPIGLHATYEPGILKQVAAAGHAIGSHTWCHQDLSKTQGHCRVGEKTVNVTYDPKDEIEMGISAVRWAVGGPTAPYFRFPALRQPPELIQYLGQRNIAIFSADFDSFDFKMRKPEQVRQSVMAKLKKFGKGIVLMHDFQHATAEASAALLNDLKAGGYKIVFMKPKDSVTTIASYDEKLMKDIKTTSGGASDRPTSTVIKTISE
jgi:peptidoglycan/xylan/chitin deacetylase (PgdA/CDA1 family)